MNTNQDLSNPLVDADWIAAHLDDPNDPARGGGRQPGGLRPGPHPRCALLWNAYTDLRRPDYSPIGARRARAASFRGPA